MPGITDWREALINPCFWVNSRPGWSRNILVMQIETGLFQRKGKAVTNFQTTLPALQSGLVHDLKATEFKPEYASKMNFYLSAVDEQVKHPTDHPRFQKP